MPAVNILNLVQKQTIKIAVNLVQYFKHVVQLFRPDVCKTLVVKIDIRRVCARFAQNFSAKG